MWIKLLLVFSCVSGSFSLDLVNFLTDNLEELDKELPGSVRNGQCYMDLLEYITTLMANGTGVDKQWALTMLDSTAKVPDGLLGGKTINIGQFDECLAVSHPSMRFSGKHCMLKLNLNNEAKTLFHQIPKNVKFGTNRRMQPGGDPQEPNIKAGVQYMTGLCIPSTCDADDLNTLLSTKIIRAAIKAAADDNSCWTKEPIQLSSGSWGFVSFMILLGVLVAVSTVYELVKVKKEPKEVPNRTLAAFSLLRNVKELFDIRVGGGMDSLHGIRTLSMMWVMLCHTYMNVISAPILNTAELIDILNDTNKMVIVNGFFSVDSFFFLSGLLVAFVFFRNIGRSGHFDAPVGYIHRYLRLTPTLMLMVVFSMTLMVDLNKGPMWYTATNPGAEACDQGWWSTLLYVQNYVNPDSTCLGQSWYLSADMQMYWISPIILYPLYLWPKIGVAFLFLTIIGSTLWTFAVDYTKGLNASLILSTSLDQFSEDYIATYTRMTPWLVGVALGFAICAIKARKINIKLSKSKVIMGWLFSSGICLGIIYGLKKFQNDPDSSDVESAIYSSFTRLGWGLGLAWVVFACIFGYGGIVNTFLSLGIFQPLGKLSYNVYLIHQNLLVYRIATTRVNFYADDLNLVYEFLGTLVLSYLFSILLYLLVEAPVANLDRALLRDIKILPYPTVKNTSGNTDIEEGVERK